MAIYLTRLFLFDTFDYYPRQDCVIQDSFIPLSFFCLFRMSLTSHQQFQSLLRDADHTLLLLPSHPSVDALASASALAYLLTKQERKVTVAADTVLGAFREYDFLLQPNHLRETLTGARDFVLSFDTKRNKIISMRTEENVDSYRIYITPEKGSVDPRDFSFIPASFMFDLVIVLDAPDKESLGKLYENNADIFYEVPVINIDHHPKNDHFGQLSIVDITASSTTEVLTDILKETHLEWIDAPLADSLLTGIIAATESFQKKNTTPKSLQIASWLMDQGANRHAIVQHLYKTHPLHLLKLWGRIMASLQWDEKTKLMHATITQNDLDEIRVTVNDLPRILDKIRTHHSTGNFFLILFQSKPNASVRGIFKTTSSDMIEQLALHWQNGTIDNDTFSVDFSTTDFLSTQRIIIGDLSRYTSP